MKDWNDDLDDDTESDQQLASTEIPKLHAAKPTPENDLKFLEQEIEKNNESGGLYYGNGGPAPNNDRRGNLGRERARGRGGEI